MVIGITGKLGSGKHTAAYLLAKYFPAKIIDVDIIGHNLYVPNTDCFEKITRVFGNDVLGHSGRNIDRKKLAAKVFNNEKMLKKLNRIMHPLLRQEVMSKIEKFQKENTHVIVIAAILTALKIPVDVLILVRATFNQTLLRIQRRDGMRKDEILKRYAFQKDPAKFDMCIENYSTIDLLEEQVVKIAVFLNK